MIVSLSHRSFFIFMANDKKKQIEVINILILIAKKYFKKIGSMRELILFKM